MISDDRPGDVGDAKTGTMGGMGPTGVLDLRDWRYEEGDAFIMRAFGTASAVLGAIAVIWTVTRLDLSSGGELVGDLVFLALVCALASMLALVALDGRALYLRRKRTYIRFSKEPPEVLEADLGGAMDALGLSWSEARPRSLLEGMGHGWDADIREYRLEGEGFRVLLEHWGPTKGEPDREHRILVVGPVTEDVHGRVPSLIQAYETRRARGPPTLHVYGDGPGGAPEGEGPGGDGTVGGGYG